MRPAARLGTYLICVIVCFGASGCHLNRPKTAPVRMIEPQLLQPSLPASGADTPKAPNAKQLRLLDTQASGHIGRHVLHKESNGELIEDAVWRWSSPPDSYLDTALRMEFASNPSVRLVDSGRNPALGATLVAWDLESSGEPRLVGAVEFQVIAPNRVIETQVIRDSEPVSAELPGDLAAAAGRLFKRLASKGIHFATSASGPAVQR